MAESYWEEYDDQDDGTFTTLIYVNLKGEEISVPITGCLAEQVAAIRRANGINVSIRVARPVMQTV